jgi:hypothetical protein
MNREVESEYNLIFHGPRGRKERLIFSTVAHFHPKLRGLIFQKASTKVLDAAQYLFGYKYFVSVHRRLLLELVAIGSSRVYRIVFNVTNIDAPTSKVNFRLQ